MSVSVAVPVRNEERTLAALLDSLLAQTIPPDEIVMADGGSADGSVTIARRYTDRGVRVIEIGPAYPGRGRNEAIRAAKNDWVALIDGGCTAEPRWLERLLASRSALGARPGAVFGEVRVRVHDEWDVAQALTWVGATDPRTGLHPPIIASCLIHRDAWARAGGFPEQLRAAEDLLFVRRLEAAGVPTVRSPEALVWWQLAPGPGAVFRRHRLYSAHQLAAGLFQIWHLRVMALDCIALLLGVAAFFWPAFLLVLGGGVVARVMRTVARRRRNIQDNRPFRIGRLLRVAVLLLLIDAATWLGALDWLLGREPPR